MKFHQMIIAIFVLCTCGITAYSNEIPSISCGRRLVKQASLIVDGYESKEGFWPWHASVFHFDLKRTQSYKCGGTLLNSNAILTASHCVYENGQPIIPDRISIQLGRNNLKTFGPNGKEFEAYRIISHPNFNSSTLRNDIAIINLATQVTFNNYIQPICLWSADKKDFSEVEGKLGTVVGFGVTKTDQISWTLQEVVMPVVRLGVCLDSNRDVFGRYLSDLTFCAGFRNGTTACNGDSGGSIVFEDGGVYRIRGIVSLTPARLGEHRELCKVDEYVVFTDVAQYLPWIKENVPVLPSPSEDHNNRKADVPTTNATIYLDELIQSLNMTSDIPVVSNFIHVSHWQHFTEPNIDIRLFNYVLGTILSQLYCRDEGYLTNRTFYIDYVKNAKDSLNETSLGDFKEHKFVSEFRNINFPGVIYTDTNPPGVGRSGIDLAISREEPPLEVDTVLEYLGRGFDAEFLFFLQQIFHFMNEDHRNISEHCDNIVKSFRKIRRLQIDLTDEKLTVFVSEFSSNVFTFATYLSQNFADKNSISDDDKTTVSAAMKSVLSYIIKSLDEIDSVTNTVTYTKWCHVCRQTTHVEEICKILGYALTTT